MANFRAFTLYNRDSTDSIELNDLNGYLVTAPTGLGIYFNNSYLNVGTKRIKTGQTLAFRPITLIIDIIGGTRQAIEGKYNDLRDFIAKYKRGGFRLAYKPSDGAYESRDGEEKQFQERYIECEIKDFDKTEKITSRYMAIPVNIEPRTYWLVDAPSKSSEVEPLATNMWIFEEQGYNTPIGRYGIGESNKTGEVELTVLGGYDKSTLPQGVHLVVNIRNILTGVESEASFNLDERKFENGVLVLERVFNRESPQNQEEKFVIRFDAANASIKAICELWADYKTDLSISDYTVDLKRGYYDSVAVFEFNGTAIDDEVEIVLYWLDHDGGHQSGTFRKASGDKYIYITMENFQAFDTQTSTVQKVERVKVPNIIYTPVEDCFTWSIVGTLLKGSREYAAGFLYDANTEEYNIAMLSPRRTIAEITNDGDNEVPLIVRIYGSAKNPTVRLTPRWSGKAIQTVKVKLDIPDGAYVEINSDPERVGAWFVQGGSRQNVTGFLDQETNMFLTLPVGEYDIEAVDDEENAVETEVFVKIEYLGA